MQHARRAHGACIGCREPTHPAFLDGYSTFHGPPWDTILRAFEGRPSGPVLVQHPVVGTWCSPLWEKERAEDMVTVCWIPSHVGVWETAPVGAWRGAHPDSMQSNAHWGGQWMPSFRGEAGVYEACTGRAHEQWLGSSMRCKVVQTST